MTRRILAALALCIIVFSCGKKEKEMTHGMIPFNLSSSYEGSASIFSNAGSTVREVTFAGKTIKADFPATSTRLIAVAPALGISDCRASSVRLNIPAEQHQDVPGVDKREGGFLYCKAPAADNPVRFDFSPMGHIYAIKVSGPSSEKLHGILLSSSTVGLAGISTLDLFKNSEIPAVSGGFKEVSVTLAEDYKMDADATLYLHTASVKCENVQMKVVMASRFYHVVLPVDLDGSKPGDTAIEINLSAGTVAINGENVPGASVAESDGGDFSSLLLLEDDGTVDRIPDFSRVGYKYGDEPIPSPAVVATIDIAAVRSALSSGCAADTTDFFQQTIDRVGNAGGGAILVKNGPYNVSRILFLDKDNVVIRGESESGTTIKYNSKNQAPIIYMGRSVPKQSTDVQTESMTFIAGRRVGISKLKAMGNEGSSSFGSVYIITYSPMSPGRTYGSNSVIMEDYVPLGRLYVEVRNPNLFKVGDMVRIYRKPTQAWLDDIGMTRIASTGRESVGSPTNQWDISGYTMSWSRKITGISGNRIYLDCPIVQSLETRYGGGELQRYSQNRIKGCGVESISFDCSYDASNIYNGSQVDEFHAWQAVQVKAAEHCWIRNVTSRHMGYALAEMSTDARCITVEKCTSLSPVSAIQGARRYAFCCTQGSELCLFKDCYCEYDRHSFVTNGTTTGPNVFTGCKSRYGYSAIGPHFGWATGILYDCIDADSNFEAQDGGCQGTGHGWRGVNTVFWNVNSNGKPIVAQSVWATCPECGQQWNRAEVCSQCGSSIIPTARNYAVGVIGVKSSHTVYWDKNYYNQPTTDFFVNLYGYGSNGENRPDGQWYPELAYGASGAENLLLPYEAPVPWWPVLKTTNFSNPRSLYQCQLEDRHARGIYLNTL